MRIKTVEVGSFGRMKGRTFSLSPGMTVFHGPNESGKTTLTEFIRNTLVPTNRREVYPSRAKTDSGTVTVDDGGTERAITLTQRTRGGDVPECMACLEPDVYRSIFAVNQDDLVDDRLMNSGELGQRFLTIPGGEGMAEVVESLSSDVSEVLGKTSSSPSRLNRTEKELASVRSSISKLRGSADSYGAVCTELAEQQAKLEAVRAERSRGRADAEIYSRYESQKGNYERLARAREERSSMGHFYNVTSDGIRNHSSLTADRRSKKESMDEASEALDLQTGRMGGTDPVRASDLEPRMRRAVEENALYRSRTGSVATAKKDRRMLLAGIALAVLGAVGAVLTPYTLVLTAAGAVIALFGTRKAQPAEDHSSYVRTYEKEVEEVMRLLGRPHTTVPADVDVMRSILEVLPEYRSCKAGYDTAKAAYNNADMKLMTFLSAFGGEEKFLQSSRMSEKARELDSSIAGLEEAIRSSGLDPDRPECPVGECRTDDSEELAISTRIGELRSMAGALLDTEELDALLDREAALVSELNDILFEGAVCCLASSIADTACTEAYGESHPEVISTADRYLGLMTDGRYRFDTDPRNKSLTIRDAAGPKQYRDWSTGLRAQAMLSLKLAVARKMGDGEVPVVLDDVLLPFDTERKLGALKALSEVASEMQVIMFTCDDQTADMAAGCPGTSVVEM